METHNLNSPSYWVKRFQPLIPHKGKVLDLAAGSGRHAYYLLNKGYRVVAVDKNIVPLQFLTKYPAAEIEEADLENGLNYSFDGKEFDGILVSNYLHRPLLEPLLRALTPSGIFIYETFARGNEIYNRPRNPNYLLCSSELIKLVETKLQIIAYEHGIIQTEAGLRVKQRICASNTLQTSSRSDKNPDPHYLFP